MFRDDYFDFTDSKPENVIIRGMVLQLKKLNMVTSMPLMMNLILALKFWSSK